MIEWQNAIREARLLLGTPYSEMDCINLIKRIIRTAPGGVPKYTTAGTNSLWKSYTMSPKYKDLTWRQEGLAGARAGMLAFKATGEDVHHVGIVTDVGTVVHASSVKGLTVETPLTGADGWNLLAIHRYIETAEAEAPAPPDTQGEAPQTPAAQVTIVDSEENVFTPVGDFRVLIGGVD